MTARASFQIQAEAQMATCEHNRLVYPWQHDRDDEGPKDALYRIFTKTKSKAKEAAATWTIMDYLSFFIPCLEWLRTYKWSKWIMNDVVAGVSVGFMVVPQGMSYANSAGLPSVYGLYGAFLPCLVYCLVGSSRQLAVGPVAVTSLLIAANLKPLVPCINDIVNPNSITDPVQQACQDQYNRASIQLAFIVACLYTGVGVLRLGWVTKFLSHAVIGGFTTGAAITIGLSQVRYILGYSINMGHSTRLQDYISEYTKKARNLRWQEFIMGIMFIFILVFFREGQRIWKPLRHIRSLGALFVCVIGILAVYIGNINEPDNGAIRIVGNIPSGLPGWTGDWWVPMEDPTFSQLIPTALIVMLVDLLESTSIARALARKNGYELNYNREIIGLGLANFAGAMSNSYTTTGSFSRSAVNNNAGAKSPLAQFVCGWIVGFVLLFLTPVFANVPFNALGAIVVVSVASLVEFEQAIYLFKVNKLDLCCWLASCFGTLFYSVEVGLGIAVGLAIMMALFQTAFPHTAVLGRIPAGKTVYRNIKQYPDAQMYPGILAFRIDSPLYFANVKSLEDKIEKAMIKFTAWSNVQGVPQIFFLIIDMTPVHHIDSMGLHFLEDLVFQCKGKGIQLILANPGRNVVNDWERIKYPDLLGRDYIFVTVHDAMHYAQQRLGEMGFSVSPLSLGAAPPSMVYVANEPTAPSSSSSSMSDVAGPSKPPVERGSEGGGPTLRPGTSSSRPNSSRVQ
eukprot:CAMPEP_0202921966 /NCGR_PEP_ID=MMETSP1392-20130828/77673_1 /ASSEMBLY_ACC=CAM_ASM_000868 /TAXON_ID=225041 /ORGANISM="Chlamydomonas chlamydogama, Strain SAG 11-48b" /LENGTH=735 /DNA_ID=CAMNT_0049615567 /DNA_START=253 /DNA_END=2460 /DNA_ORIENTATION=-